MSKIESAIQSAEDIKIMFYQDPTFWAGMSFVVVLLILIKPIYKFMLSSMNKKIDSIKNNFQEAEELELEANRLLASYKEKVSNLNYEIENILNKSKQEIEDLKKKSVEDLEREVDYKKKENYRFIEEMKLQTQREISNNLSDKVIDILKETLNKNQNQDTNNALIEASINNIKNIKKSN